MRIFFPFAALGAASFLSGCLSGNANEVAQDYVDEIGRITTRLSGYSETATLPGGSASYDGIATLLYAESDAATSVDALVGDMALTADFESGQIRGWADNWVGVRDVSASDINNDVAQDGSFAAGQLDIGGSFDATEIDGRLSMGGTTYEVGGTGSTSFLGPSAEGAVIYGDTDSGLTLSADGVDGVGLFAGVSVQR